MRSPEEEPQGPVIRDRRRIDPATGQVRDPSQAGQAPRGPGQPRPGKHSVSKPGGSPGAGAAGAAGAQGGGERPDGAADVTATRLAERTADLQRLQAEYANYRKRVDRDRMVVREQALANVLSELLPVIDDIGRAREHGELTGGFKSVAESLEAAVAKLGLTSYGENGDPFDPTVHEALMHSFSADVTEPTCVRILQPGYKVGDRILRPARVAVEEPGDDQAPADAGADADAGDSPAPAAAQEPGGSAGAVKAEGAEAAAQAAETGDAAAGRTDGGDPARAKGTD
jgi:molecular chaperone GrpE